MSAPKLLDLVREAIRVRQYSRRTERAYVSWIRRYVLFHGKQHPSALNARHVSAFLTHLASDRDVASSTQNQALHALLFLYRHVLENPLPQLQDVVRARRSRHLPVVLTRDEVRSMLRELTGVHHLVASLLYGAGLRLLEALRLRVKDLDFGAGQVVVRGGKGDKDRVTPLPARLREPLRTHLRTVRLLHEQDLREGFGTVELPRALARKYPHAARSWAWQYVFPASGRSRDPRSGEVRRHHLHESAVQKAVAAALRRSGIPKRGSCHNSGTPSPHTCSRPTTTSAPSRSCSATATYAPP